MLAFINGFISRTSFFTSALRIMLCSSSLVIICRFMVLAGTIGSAGDEASVRLFFRTLGLASVCNPLAVVFLLSVILGLLANGPERLVETD